jgi:hypothetical protein
MMMAAGVCLAQEPGAPASTPMPAALGESLMMVHVGEVSGLVLSAGDLAGKFQPGMSGIGLKGMAGMMVQDAELSGFGPGAGLEIYYFKGNVVMGFAKISAAKMQGYKDFMGAQMHGVKVDSVGDLLVFATFPMDEARSAEALTTAKRLAPAALKSMSDLGAKPTFKFVAYPGKAIESFDSQIKGFLQMISSMQGGMKANAIMNSAMIAALGDAKEFSIEFNPAPSAFQAEITLIAKPGTPLAKSLESPAKPALSDMALLPADGALRVAVGVNSMAYANLIEEYAKKAFVELNVSEQEQKDFMSLYHEPMKMYGDKMQLSMSMLTPGQGLISGSGLTRLPNVETAIQIIEKQVAQMKDNAMLKQMEQAGLKMDVVFNKDVRKHKDVSIHQWKMTMQSTNAGSAEKNTEMEKMLKLLGNLEYDMAFLDGVMVTGLGGVPVESLIDAVQSKVNPAARPMASVSAFGPQADAYVDFDLGKIMELVSGFAAANMPAGQPNPVEMMANELKGASPVVASWVTKDGSVVGSIKAPLDLITQLGQGIQNTQQKLSQGDGSPAKDSTTTPSM